MILSPVLKQRFFDSNGNPLAGGKLYSYAAGTTTPQDTYTDAAGGAANTNPVVLDANGEATVFIDPALTYKFTLTDSSEAQQWSVDNVGPDDTISTDHIIDDAVTADKLADSADTDGDRAVTTNHIRDSAVTWEKLSASDRATGTTADLGGVALSSSSSTFTTTATDFVDVTNLSVTLTTKGRPVVVTLVPDGSSNAAILGWQNQNAASINTIELKLLRGATEIARTMVYGGTSDTTYEHQMLVPPSTFMALDTPAAGTHTYTFQVVSGSASRTAKVQYIKLMAYEI